MERRLSPRASSPSGHFTWMLFPISQRTMATSQSALSEVSLAEWDDALLENVKMLAIKLTLGTTQKLERETPRTLGNIPVKQSTVFKEKYFPRSKILNRDRLLNWSDLNKNSSQWVAHEHSKISQLQDLTFSSVHGMSFFAPIIHIAEFVLQKSVSISEFSSILAKTDF